MMIVKPILGRLRGTTLLGLLCFLGLVTLVAPVARASNHSPDADAAYAAAMEELYEDERPALEDFYRKLTPEGRAVFARLVNQLEPGQRGVMAHSLARSPTEAANNIMAMFDGFAQPDFANATKRLGYNEFSDWDALIAVLSVEHPDIVGAEFTAASNSRCATRPTLDAQGNVRRPEDLPDGIRWCSAAISEFRTAYFPSTGYITRGYTLGTDEARYQAQFSLFGPSTDAHKTDAARDEQKAQFGRTLKDWEINHTCGGVYIGSRFVLTAAHCVVTSLSNQRFFDGRRVRLGAHSIETTDGLIPIRTAVTHMGYNSRTLLNDIALLELEYAPRGSAVANLPPSAGYPPGSTDLLVSGWGYVRPTVSADNPRGVDGEFQDKAAPELRGGRLEVFEDDVCNNNRAFRRDRLRVLEGQICAGSRQGVDSCRGDSGGPLVDTQSNTLVGIVSGGKGCGLFNSPSIYVDVAHYLGWIERAKSLARRSGARTRRAAP